MTSLALLPVIPRPLSETGAVTLEWARLREYIAGKTVSPLGRGWMVALEPSADLPWIAEQHQRTDELRGMLTAGGSFTFYGLFDPGTLLEKARIEGLALEGLEILSLLEVVGRVAAWRTLVEGGRDAPRYSWPSIAELSAPLLGYDLGPLLRLLRGKIEPDGSLADDASPELRRIRRAMERQHRTIEESLRRAARKLREEGSTQSASEDLITIRGERFVIPVKAEFKRRVPGVVHASSSSGQTVYVEPLETIEQNNELVRLLDEEQGEIHKILVAMTRALAGNADAIEQGCAILAEVEAHHAKARFALELDCVRPEFGEELELTEARHPLLELRMRGETREAGTIVASPVPLTIALPEGARQLVISGPNTGGKTVSLKTLGLLALMAQAGVPVPAAEAKLPLFSAIYADIGDAQSIERNLSSFSAHVVNVDRIAREAVPTALVLLDELGSATDPEEGAALAVAIAEHFLGVGCWCAITTHLTSLKVYAANHAGVLNAAVGFDAETLSPTYELRLGVPGASAGLNIAARLGMQEAIVAAARTKMTTQTADIGAFLDQLHAQLTAAAGEREALQGRERELSRERAKLEVEGRVEQKARTKELEGKLNMLLGDFEAQLRETVKAIDDKAVSARIQRDSALRMARVRREFSEQFNSTVVAHNTRADKGEAAAGRKPAAERAIAVGDLVSLRSLGRQARVERVVDGKTLEVSVGTMKMRVDRGDVAGVEQVKAVTPLDAARRRGGVTVQTSAGGGDAEYVPLELNVIGRRAEEAQTEVERYLDRAFLAGLPRVRIVHGTGMGVLRRALREFLKGHPHVTTITEPPANQGGQGATEVELRQ